MTATPDNNKKLRDLWGSTGLSQIEALALMNAGQIRKTSVSTFNAYMAPVGISRRRACPDEILKYAEKVLSRVKRSI